MSHTDRWHHARLNESARGVLETAVRAERDVIRRPQRRFNPGEFLTDFRLGLGRPGRLVRALPVAVLGPVFEHRRRPVRRLRAHTDSDDVHGESPGSERRP